MTLSKTDNKVADETARMRRLACALLLEITEDRFLQSQSKIFMTFYHERLESKMRNLIFVKYDITRIEALFAQSLQCICSVYVSCW